LAVGVLVGCAQQWVARSWHLGCHHSTAKGCNWIYNHLRSSSVFLENASHHFRKEQEDCGSTSFIRARLSVSMSSVVARYCHSFSRCAVVAVSQQVLCDTLLKRKCHFCFSWRWALIEATWYVLITFFEQLCRNPSWHGEINMLNAEPAK
jgi:hypothetical protein